MKHRFTPRISGGERLKLLLDDENIEKIERGGPWSAIITSIDGRKWKVKGASCGLQGCFCDAIAKEIK